ncbi:MAG: hypothetical protein ACI3YW_01445 [Candidatus Egerieousia sp.]
MHQLSAASRCCRIVFHAGNSGQQQIPDGFPPQRPGQQQTSFGGEKYSGLASNLAHLGRIC